MSDDLFDDIQAFLASPNKEKPLDGLLSEDDMQVLILAFAAARGEKGFTEDELLKLVRWCELQITGEALVRLMLKGYIFLDDPSGKFENDVVAALTPYGREMKKKLQ